MIKTKKECCFEAVNSPEKITADCTVTKKHSYRSGERRIEMNKKKIIAFTLAAAMLLGTAGTAAFAEEEAVLNEIFDDNDCFEFEETEESTFPESISEISDVSVMMDDAPQLSADLIEDEELDYSDPENDFEDGFAENLEDAFSEGFESDADLSLEDVFEEELSEEPGDELEAAFEDAFDDSVEIVGEEDLESADIILAAAEEKSWKTLFTKAGGKLRQVMIFEREDGTWSDDKGVRYTQKEDGTWTNAKGVVYWELTGDDDDLFDNDDFLEDQDPDDFPKNDGSRDTAFDTFVTETKKVTQGVINGFLDSIARTRPDLLPVLGALKVLVGEMFGLGSAPNSNQVMLDKLNEIEIQLKNMEESLKEHMENVVTFDSIGGEFQAVADAIPPLECKIGDAMGKYQKGKIDEDELNRRIAAFYDMGEYSDLMHALSGATNSYNADTSFSLDKRSIFSAAYRLQCEKVMFSGEAVDCVTPYLLRQLCTYLKGYALINTVLDAYEAVNGDDSTLYTRQVMFQNTGGIVKGTFNEQAPGVFGLYRDFFNTYRYTFVNKSSNPANHVRLGKDIYAVFGFSETFLGSRPTVSQDQSRRYTPDGLSNFPLNAAQMKSLAEYAAAKKTTLFNLLFNTVGFELQIYPSMTLMRYFGMDYGRCTPESVINLPIFGSRTLREILRDGTTYIPTGNQYIILLEEWFDSHRDTPCFNCMQAIRANKVGAGDERLTLTYTHDPKWESRAINPNMLFFTR